jgi:hypothetical protein
MIRRRNVRRERVVRVRKRRERVRRKRRARVEGLVLVLWEGMVCG